MPDMRLGAIHNSVPQYKMLHITGSGTLIPVGLCVNTTIAAAITAGSGVVITPASMTNIIAGKRLNIVNGSTYENVSVLAATSTTFTANFVNSYPINSNLYSTDGTVLGPIVVGSPGTSITLTLYNGLPGMVPRAGASFAVLSLSATAPNYEFAGVCDQGLFYTASGTCDVTIHYLDHPPQRT